jgi:hypothetical protein
MSCAFPEDCDDGLFCDGVETCVDTICVAGENPCDELTQQCVEETDTCEPLESGCTSDADCRTDEYCDTNTGICQPNVVVNCGAGAGNCFVANFTAGCESESCCDIICRLVDPACCFVSWDEQCRDAAFQYCSVAP